MIMLFLALACGGDKDSEPDPVGPEDTGGLCASAPILSWENFGQGLLVEHCQACHGSDAPYRDGETPPPESVVFDTYEDAMTWKDRILAVTLGDGATMPPRGGLTDLDQQRLEIWLVCGEEE